MKRAKETRQERRERERNQKKTPSLSEEFSSTDEKVSRKPHYFLSGLLGVIIALLGVKLIQSDSKQYSQTESNKESWSQASLGDLTYAKVLDLSPERVPQIDIAELNLLCGSNLIGTRDISKEKCIEQLDRLTDMARNEVQRNRHRWQKQPGEYKNSEAYYKMSMLISAVRLDYKAQYNPKLISMPSLKAQEKDEFFSNGADVFLQGLLSERKMGTCASMPVLYVAIGRRLGYPVHLVATKGHLFCRWDDGRERMNFEATGDGISTHPDSYYLKWPFKVTNHELKNSTYLKNMNRQQELAMFLSNRAECLIAEGRNEEGLVAVAQALRLVSRNGGLTGIIPQLAVRPLIPIQVFQTRANRNRDPLAEILSPGQRPTRPRSGTVPLPPDPSAYRPITPAQPQQP